MIFVSKRLVKHVASKPTSSDLKETEVVFGVTKTRKSHCAFPSFSTISYIHLSFPYVLSSIYFFLRLNRLPEVFFHPWDSTKVPNHLFSKAHLLEKIPGRDWMSRFAKVADFPSMKKETVVEYCGIMDLMHIYIYICFFICPIKEGNLSLRVLKGNAANS